MKKGLLIVVGVLVALAGVVFTLQGLNVMGNSAMSGHTVWAIAGPVIALAGVVLAIVGVRAGRLGEAD